MGAKKALSGFSESLFEDVREYSVKVCTINPGYVNTPMVKSDIRLFCSAANLHSKCVQYSSKIG